jgi:hypothetical protein
LRTATPKTPGNAEDQWKSRTEHDPRRRLPRPPGPQYPRPAVRSSVSFTASAPSVIWANSRGAVTIGKKPIRIDWDKNLGSRGVLRRHRRSLLLPRRLIPTNPELEALTDPLRAVPVHSFVERGRSATRRFAGNHPTVADRPSSLTAPFGGLAMSRSVTATPMNGPKRRPGANGDPQDSRQRGGLVEVPYRA